MKKKGIIIGIASVMLVTGILFGVTEVQAQICGVEGCIERSEHEHYNCGIADCTERNEHEHYNCGVTGCNKIGEHSHKKESHHSSSHKKGHH